MPLQVICPACRKPLQLPDGVQGKPVRCPLCQGVFAVAPAAPKPPAAAPPAPRPVAPAPAAVRPAPPPPPPPPVPAQKVTRDVPPPVPARQPDALEVVGREDAPSLPLVLEVKADPDREMTGIYLGELNERGLRLTQDETRIRVPIPARAEHAGGGRVGIDIDGRIVSFAVAGFVAPEGTSQMGALMRNHRTNKHRVAADLVASLKGKRAGPLSPADYLLPWYLFAPAVLPLGIPILTLGGILPLLVGIALSAACVAIVQRDRWPTFLRLGLSLGICGVSYAVVIAILILVTGVTKVKFGGHQKPTIAEKEWQTYQSPEGDFEVLLPGKPEVLTDPYPGVQVKLSRPQVTFRVHHFTVEPARQLDLSDPGAADSAIEVWPEMLAEAIREYPESKRDYGSVGGCPELKHHCRFTDSNRKRSDRVMTDCHFGRFGDRVYCATIISPYAQAMEYDVNKFLKSVRIHRPRDK